ncbi:MAG: NAD(+)/NADH kinase [Candidatus Borkfalkiaceae bacterium]|nr:NAD(+)/NADH kinase [Clostridia bacterium]MDY6224008.1 NAD(+)/NADH kinase [Christensenellaceae bacterium]
MKTGVYVNSERTKKSGLAEEFASFLQAKGFDCKTVSAPLSAELGDIGMLFVLGGDGTILHCAEPCARNGVKIVGINFGTLGFLAEFEKDEIESVPRFLREIEEGKTAEIKRRLLKITYKSREFFALNEAAIRRDYSVKDGRMLKADILVNGYEFDVLSGDGALVSTPTGSTAYSLSAGGPIISPQTPALLYTPLCAFSLAARPVVFSDGDKIDIKVTRGGAFLLADGVVCANVEEGDAVSAEISDLYAAFPTRSFTGFYKKVRKKLG